MIIWQTFNLKSHCGCINQCLPSPGPTKPGSTTPAPTGPTTPSTRPERPTTLSPGTKTPSSGPGGKLPILISFCDC